MDVNRWQLGLIMQRCSPESEGVSTGSIVGPARTRGGLRRDDHPSQLSGEPRGGVGEPLSIDQPGASATCVGGSGAALIRRDRHEPRRGDMHDILR